MRVRVYVSLHPQPLNNLQQQPIVPYLFCWQFMNFSRSETYPSNIQSHTLRSHLIDQLVLDQRTIDRSWNVSRKRSVVPTITF